MPRSDNNINPRSGRSRVTTLLLLSFTTLFSVAQAQDDKRTSPNFLIILADDLGYTDIGAFGGEIETPNLDRLASEGLKLVNFYASPACSPTRAMLLSGVDHHQAGLGNMAEELAPNQIGKPGYEGYLNSRIISLAELLKANNYRTYMTGKWHLGLQPDHGPSARGFDRSFALLQGGGSHFDQSGLAAASPKSLYREDGRLVDLPENFYSSDFYTSKLISYFSEDRESTKPFLAYLAFTAPHWPLQAPEDLIEKYQQRYEAGYQEIQKDRIKRAEILGVIPKAPEIDKTFSGRQQWSELNGEDRRTEARKMAVYAAMVDRMDQNIGQVIQYLEDNDMMENTYVIFMSDNGAEGHDFTGEAWLDGWINTFDNSYENIGRINSYIWYGPNWAQAGMAPFRLHKAFPTEGGIHVPAFVYEKKLHTAGQTSHAVLSVMDIMPTILQLSDISHPEIYKGQAVLPMQGLGFAGILADQNINKTSSVPNLGWELFGKRGYRYGDWKAVHMPPPDGTGQWQLYNLKADPGETRDLAADNPDELDHLVRLWNKYAKENNIIIPNEVSGY